MTNQPQVSRALLRIIQLALLSGVVGFGVVAWFLRRAGKAPVLASGASPMLPVAFLVLLVSTLAALFAIRRFAARAPGFQEAGNFCIVAWALGEGLALLGGLIYLFTGAPALYFVGTAVLIGAYALVPIPEER